MFEKCNENCQFNDHQKGCVKPDEVTCTAFIDIGGDKKVHILGEVWSIKERSESEDERLKNCDGYCDWTTKEIVVEREICGNLNDMEKYIRKVMRHEIVHAFLLESGLNECAGDAESWAANEEMVDWIARQGPKIYAAWKEAGALDEYKETD